MSVVCVHVVFLSYSRIALEDTVEYRAQAGIGMSKTHTNPERTDHEEGTTPDEGDQNRKSIVSDSFLVENAVSNDELMDHAFALVQEEVQWSDMFHKGGPVPRKVAIQGDMNRSSMVGSGNETIRFEEQPIYRHPTDEQPALQDWTPTVRRLRDCVQACTGQVINHALIQMYRNGDDYISEHADKTIDVQRDSAIFNLSLGATRTLMLRPKREQAHGAKTALPREAIRVPLHHGSLFGLGWKTNQTMTHEIKRDKRHERDKTARELDFRGCRISITFRHVATFMVLVKTRTTFHASPVLFGQGAKKYKTRAQALEAAKFALSWHRDEERTKLDEGDDKDKPIRMGELTASNDGNESERLLQAFSEENRRADFDWEQAYGDGFDVINIQIV